MKTSYRRVEILYTNKMIRKTNNEISNATNEIENFSFKSLITSKIEKFQFALIQPKAQEIFFL